MIISVAIGAAIYALTRSIAMAAGSILGGVIIDLDHFIEYFIHRGIRIDLRDMFYVSYHNLFARLYLLFHSYEVLLIAWILAVCFIRSNLLMGFAIGFTGHMILDRIFNPARPLGYFFTFRAIKKFEAERIQLPGTKGKLSPSMRERFRKSPAIQQPPRCDGSGQPPKP